MATTLTTTPSADYLFDTGSDEGGRHMQLLAEVFDPASFSVLDPIDLRAGQRCLDVGAGGGSVARRLAEKVGPGGEVVAMDIDTTRLSPAAGITVRRHDIHDGLSGPVAGPYDLIHARLVLMHLPRRDEIFAALVDALAPGGHLVVGDITDRPLAVLSRSDQKDIAVWRRVQYLSHAVVSPAGGIDFGWAGRINEAMVEAGLSGIEGVETSWTVRGGTAGALLHASLNRQAHDHLLAAGAELWELDRYQQLAQDPDFRTWFYQFVCLRGRRAH